MRYNSVCVGLFVSFFVCLPRVKFRVLVLRIVESLAAC